MTTRRRSRSVLRVVLTVLVGTVAALALVGMHGFHPEEHLGGHSSSAAVHASDESQPASPQHPGQTDDVSRGGAACTGCGTDGGHTMLMVLCLLTLLVSAAVSLLPPLSRRVRPSPLLRALNLRPAPGWLATAAPAHPPSLQVLSISRT